MVDLGFLLITFFVFTTSMTRPTAMKLYLPAGDIPTTPTGESTILTVIPVAADKIFYYHGELQKAMQIGLYGITGFDVNNGIGSIIRQKQTALDENPKFTRKDLMLIIKPSPASSYQNIVEVLDEVLINNIIHYTLVDIDAAEKNTLQKQHIE
jgi:biopolymer transport protein ExbD